MSVSFALSIDLAASGFKDVPEFAKAGGRGVVLPEEDGREDLCVSELLQEGDGRNGGGVPMNFSASLASAVDGLFPPSKVPSHICATCSAAERVWADRSGHRNGLKPVAKSSLSRAKRANEVTIFVTWCVMRGTGR